MVLAVLAAAFSFAPAPDPSALPPEPLPRERIEAISLAANGVAGSLETTPEFMRGVQQIYRFGEGSCARIAPALLEQLVAAMRARTYVRIEAVPGKHRGVSVQCIAGATFYPA